MKRKIFGLLVLAFSVLTFASSAFAVSEAAALFLLINPGARPGGMGEAFMGIADDATGIYYNPACSGYFRNSRFHFMHSNWLPGLADDLFYDHFAGTYHVEGLGTFGANITFLNLGTQQETDETGNPGKTFKSYNFASSVNYAYQFSETQSLGVGLKVIWMKLADNVVVANEKTDGSAVSAAVDIGYMDKSFFNPDLTFGVSISNIGPKVTFVDADQADPLPTNLRVGFGYKLLEDRFNKLTVLYDINRQLIKADRMDSVDTDSDGKFDSTVGGGKDPVYKAIFTTWTDDNSLKRFVHNFGAEYWYSDLVALRGGYIWDPEGKIEAPTLGFGLKYLQFRFDFGIIVTTDSDHPLSNTLRFSLDAQI
ncbi:PorV/PorQ family protein [bacterium]|nr:PorV/PorQ family protein [bacterium]